MELRNYYHGSTLYSRYTKLRNSLVASDKIAPGIHLAKVEGLSLKFRNAGAGAEKFYQRTKPEPREDFSPLNAVQIPSIVDIINEQKRSIMNRLPMEKDSEALDFLNNLAN